MLRSQLAGGPDGLGLFPRHVETLMVQAAIGSAAGNDESPAAMALFERGSTLTL